MDRIETDDSALAELIREARFDGTPADLRDMIAGINAAPAAADADAWLSLVAPEAPVDVADRLRRLRSALAEAAGSPGPAPGDPVFAERLAALRGELLRRDLTGFVLPRADAYQSEFLPARAERLAWLTGFTGSAGVAVVLTETAAIFVDGRYTLQAAAQVDTGAFVCKHLIEEPPTDWIRTALPAGGRLGYDPWLHTVNWVERMRRAAEEVGGELVALDDNPVDAIWHDQPPLPLAPVVPHGLDYAGRPSHEKRAALAEAMVRDGVDAAVLTAPESIAWLLNIRGGDVPNTPLPLAFAILESDGCVTLFIDRRKLTRGLDVHLGNQVSIAPPEELGPAIDRLGHEGRTVQADPAGAAAWVFERLHRASATIRREPDPCSLPKARKNEVELEGARAAHVRDGAAMCRFLAWLAAEAPSGRISEAEAADRLVAFRAEGALYRGSSFEAISAAGPNAAVVHYRASAETNRRLEPGTPYLIDSGAQYLDGTTDITRTVAVGEAGAEIRDAFTRVLKGHIAVATARFPAGTTGPQLDTLARQYLWQAGLDFDHGTGHGVGSYLGVHEGPQRISKMPNNVALEPGMILSNEPGYYKTDAYGIRIENLIAVGPCRSLAHAERPMLDFEVLTLAPIDRALIAPGLMSPAELAWLDAYHARVRATLGPLLDHGAAAWLERATAPLAA